LSVDPLTKSFPWFSPYQYAGNSPIKFIDIDGAEVGAPIVPGAPAPAANAITNNYYGFGARPGEYVQIGGATFQVVQVTTITRNVVRNSLGALQATSLSPGKYDNMQYGTYDKIDRAVDPNIEGINQNHDPNNPSYQVGSRIHGRGNGGTQSLLVNVEVQTVTFQQVILNPVNLNINLAAQFIPNTANFTAAGAAGANAQLTQIGTLLASDPTLQAVITVSTTLAAGSANGVTLVANRNAAIVAQLNGVPGVQPGQVTTNVDPPNQFGAATPNVNIGIVVPAITINPQGAVVPAIIANLPAGN
jgi:hypothetical protein